MDEATGIVEKGLPSASFDKGRDEEIRVRVQEFRGKAYIDCRVFYTDEQGEQRPSKKGLCLPVTFLTDFVKALADVQKQLEEQDEARE